MNLEVGCWILHCVGWLKDGWQLVVEVMQGFDSLYMQGFLLFYRGEYLLLTIYSNYPFNCTQCTNSNNI